MSPEPMRMLERLHAAADRWQVTIREIRETGTALLGFGVRAEEAVVIKIARAGGDEWKAGAVAAAFQGRGMVRVLAHEPGAVLLEQLRPGTPLIERVLAGQDRAATEALARIVHSMHAVAAVGHGAVPLRALAVAFDQYVESGDTQIERELVRDARDRFLRLCDTQREERLLHGDLQHSNVLLDDRRGWVAVDPKGLKGELEYEVGATFRNPKQAPDLYPCPSTIRSRMQIFTGVLRFDAARALEWVYAQAVLSAVWVVEDGSALGEASATIQLAVAARDMLDRSWS